MNNKIIAAVVIVLLVVLGIMYFTNSNDDFDLMESQDETLDINENGDGTESDGNSETGTIGTQSTVALAPTATGKTVVVSRTSLSKPGYVVIYRVNSNNDTSVIGNSDLLSAGVHSNISIELDAIVAREQTIVAVLHEDDGDGEFEFPGSDGYLGSSNKAVVSFVDVVDVSADEEDVILKENVELYLEENIDA